MTHTNSLQSLILLGVMLLLGVILSLNFVSANYVENHGRPIVSNDPTSSNVYSGMRIIVGGSNIYFYTAVKNASCTADHFYILNSAKVQLINYSFSGSNATTTTYYNMTNGTTYYFACRKEDGTSYGLSNGPATYNISGQTLNFTGGLNTAGADTTTSISCLETLYFYNASEIGNLLNYTLTYNSTALETSIQGFALNLTYNSTYYTSSTAYLIYNQTSYLGTKTGTGNNVKFSTMVTAPLIGFSSTPISFYWNVSLTNSSGYSQVSNTVQQAQTVTPITLTFCNSTYNVTYMNFSFYDETSGKKLNATFDSLFTYSLYENSAQTKIYSYVNLNQTNSSYKFCASPSYPLFILSADIGYTSLGYSDRTKYIRNTSITNITSEIPLLLLNDSVSVKFFFTVTQNLVPLTNAVVMIAKYQGGSYSNIGTRLTDESGKFIEYLEIDTPYQYIISKNGVYLNTIYQTSSCASAPCEKTLEVGSSQVDLWQGYYDVFASNVAYNLTYDSVGKMVTYTFVDLTGLATNFRLQVTQGSYNSSGTTICNNILYSTSGTLTCNVTNYKGDFTARGYVSRSPEKLVNYITFAIKSLAEAFGKNEGLFFTLIALVTVVLIGVWSPAVGIILAIAVFFLFNIVGFLTLGWGIISLIAILGIIVIIKMGRGS